MLLQILVVCINELVNKICPQTLAMKKIRLDTGVASSRSSQRHSQYLCNKASKALAVCSHAQGQ